MKVEVGPQCIVACNMVTNLLARCITGHLVPVKIPQYGFLDLWLTSIVVCVLIIGRARPLVLSGYDH